MAISSPSPPSSITSLVDMYITQTINQSRETNSASSYQTLLLWSTTENISVQDNYGLLYGGRRRIHRSFNSLRKLVNVVCYGNLDNTEHWVIPRVLMWPYFEPHLPNFRVTENNLVIIIWNTLSHTIFGVNTQKVRGFAWGFLAERTTQLLKDNLERAIL